MDSWIVQAISGMGYMGVGLLMFFENLFPPIPSELIMPLSGYFSARGQMDFWTVVIAGTVGGVAGQVLLYWVARKVGEERLEAFAAKHGRWLTLSPQDLKKASGWFRDHGGRTVFICRLLPALRSLVSLPAGFARMHFAPFLLYTTAGTGLWTLALAYAGRLLGSNFQQIDEFLGPITWVVLIGALLIYLYRVVTFKPEPQTGGRPDLRAETAKQG